MKKILVLFLLFPFVISELQGQVLEDSLKKTLIVAVKESPPFVIKEADGIWDGLSVDLWEDVASRMGVSFQYKEYELTEILGALEKHEADISINPLTVTSKRIEQVDFTQPFYISHLAIATNREEQNTIMLFLSNLFSLAFLQAILLLALVICIFGLLLWLAERKKNTEQFGRSKSGLWNGIWWSAVTMTTVGYGDTAPVTTAGRIIAMVWMFTAIIIISGFTASIASALTVNHLESGIKSPDDLKAVKVGSIVGSSSEGYLERNGIGFKGYQDVTTGLTAVANQEIDAFVYDKPLMSYVIRAENLGNKVQILPYKFYTQYYGFALPQKSPLRLQINPLLLEEINSVRWKAALEEFSLGD